MIILFNEYFIYHLQRLRWDNVACETENCNRILFVADPQLLGEVHEFWFARSDSDRHIRRNYRQAFSHVRPDAVIFLGDLTDEASIADDAQFRRYHKRFMKIFPKVEGVIMIYLPGDNDIGGEGYEPVKPLKFERFRRFFGSENYWNLKNNLSVYHINHITDEIPKLTDEEIIEAQESLNATRLLIGHYPIMQSGWFSEKAIGLLKPHVSFVAHHHLSSYVMNKISQLSYYPQTKPLMQTMTFDLKAIVSSLEILEIQVLTCSYRMGVLHIGFGQAVLADGKLHYTPLFIVNRFLQFGLYAVFLILFIAVNCCLKKHCEHPRYRRIK